MPKLKISNETFWVIFKHCVLSPYSMISLLSLKDKKKIVDSKIWNASDDLKSRLNCHTGVKPNFLFKNTKNSKVGFLNLLTINISSNIWIFAPKIMSIWILGSGLVLALLGAKIQMVIFYLCKNTWNALKNWVSYPWWTMKDFLHFCPLCIVKFKKLHRWLTPTQTILSPF